MMIIMCVRKHTLSHRLNSDTSSLRMLLQASRTMSMGRPVKDIRRVRAGARFNGWGKSAGGVLRAGSRHGKRCRLWGSADALRSWRARSVTRWCTASLPVLQHLFRRHHHQQIPRYRAQTACFRAACPQTLPLAPLMQAPPWPLNQPKAKASYFPAGCTRALNLPNESYLQLLSGRVTRILHGLGSRTLTRLERAMERGICDPVCALTCHNVL